MTIQNNTGQTSEIYFPLYSYLMNDTLGEKKRKNTSESWKKKISGFSKSHLFLHVKKVLIAYNIKNH